MSQAPFALCGQFSSSVAGDVIIATRQAHQGASQREDRHSVPLTDRDQFLKCGMSAVSAPSDKDPDRGVENSAVYLALTARWRLGRG